MNNKIDFYELANEYAWSWGELYLVEKLTEEEKMDIINDVIYSIEYEEIKEYLTEEEIKEYFKLNNNINYLKRLLLKHFDDINHLDAFYDEYNLLIQEHKIEYLKINNILNNCISRR